MQTIHSDRYHVLNLTNLASGRRNTVEFRVFSGTTSSLKIVAWVRLCLAIVELAVTMRRGAKFLRSGRENDGGRKKRGGWYRSGVGHTAVCYMFYRLGWCKGTVSHRYGDLDDERLPSFKDCKAELVRLGKKYDTCTL